MFDIKKILLCIRDSLIKNTNTKTSIINDNIRDDIINVNFKDDSIVIEIKEECNFMEYSNTIDKCYNKLNETFIPMKILITNGGNIFNWRIYKQKVYILKNNGYDFMISVSKDEIKISQTILKDDLYNETELCYNLNEEKYIIYKLIHDLNRSTKCPNWYPENYDCPFYLDKDEAYVLFNELFNNLKDIQNIESIICDINNMENIIKKDFNIKRKVL